MTTKRCGRVSELALRGRCTARRHDKLVSRGPQHQTNGHITETRALKTFLPPHSRFAVSSNQNPSCTQNPRYIYIYIQSFATPENEASASDSVLNSGWDSRRVRFPGFGLAFSAAFLEGRARRGPTGVLPCAHLGVSRYRRARRPRTQRIFVGVRGHGGYIFFGSGYLFRYCCPAKRLFIVTDSILAFFFSRPC